MGQQVGLEKLRISLTSKDPLDIVNAFMRIPTTDIPMLHTYWEYRLCVLAEFIVDTIQATKDNDTNSVDILE